MKQLFHEAKTRENLSNRLRAESRQSHKKLNENWAVALNRLADMIEEGYTTFTVDDFLEPIHWERKYAEVVLDEIGTTERHVKPFCQGDTLITIDGRLLDMVKMTQYSTDGIEHVKYEILELPEKESFLSEFAKALGEGEPDCVGENDALEFVDAGRRGVASGNLPKPPQRRDSGDARAGLP